MTNAISIDIRDPGILVATHRPGKHRGVCLEGLRNALRQAADIPARFALVTDLSRVIDTLDFDDLMGLAGFWAAERRRITRHAAVVQVPDDWKPAIETLNLYSTVLKSDARIGLFETIGEAIRWIQFINLDLLSAPRSGSSA
jgi:hypothetical protein